MYVCMNIYIYHFTLDVSQNVWNESDSETIFSAWLYANVAKWNENQ